MKIVKLLACLLIFSPLVFSGCAEQAGNGDLVPIPFVTISCTSNYCKQGFPAKAYIVYTTSSCANAQFGETVAGSTTLACNGTGCSGTIISFSTASGGQTNVINSGFYSICAVLDFNSNYIGTAAIGDSTGGLANANISSGATTQILTSFSDL